LPLLNCVKSDSVPHLEGSAHLRTSVSSIICISHGGPRGDRGRTQSRLVAAGWVLGLVARPASISYLNNNITIRKTQTHIHVRFTTGCARRCGRNQSARRTTYCCAARVGGHSSSFTTSCLHPLLARVHRLRLPPSNLTHEHHHLDGPAHLSPEARPRRSSLSQSVAHSH
jgi:hypothetical protein